MIEPDDLGTVTSFDGTNIAYQVFGQGPPLIVANGIGVGYQGLALQIEHLRHRFRVVCWDHRGIFDSDPPGPGGVTVEAQARDALAVMNALSIEQAGFVGWSMGVQVGFELLRLCGERITRVVCLGGVAGNPFRTALPVPFVHRLLPSAVSGAAYVMPFLSPLTRPVMTWDGFYRAACLAGYIQPTADRHVFMAMARGVASHDPSMYLRTLAELGRHDATTVLQGVRQPVLFVAGGRDYMVPRAVLERTAGMIADGRVYTVEQGSHFALIEAPREVNALLEGFFLEDAASFA